MITPTLKTAPSNGSQPKSSRSHRLDKHFSALVRKLNLLGNGATGAIGVTGCGRFSGASSVAMNLAISVAENGSRRVLLIDANTIYPAVARHFKLAASPGLSELLCGFAEIDNCVQQTSVSNLSVLAAGSREALSMDFCNPEVVSQTMDQLREHFDMLVVDLPLAHELSTCYSFAGLLDGVLMVIEAERVTSEAARFAKHQLTQARANVLGVVLNKRQYHGPSWLA